MLLVRLGEKDDGVGVLERDLIFEQTHVVMIALEAVLHHEKVDANECLLGVRIVVVRLHDLALADLVRALHLLHERAVAVDAVALLEDDGVDLSERLLHALSLDLELRRVEVDDAFIAEAHLSHLSEALFDGLSFDSGQVLVRLPDVLVGVLGQQSEVARWDNFSED